MYCFNPRSREGSDETYRTKGWWKECFNPRSREGSDEMKELIPAFDEKFQSTLPRRERPEATEKGMDEDAVSIHAPAKGATC